MDLLHRKVQSYKFSNKNDHFCAWRDFNKTFCGISAYHKWMFKLQISSIFNFDQAHQSLISGVLGVNACRVRKASHRAGEEKTWRRLLCEDWGFWSLWSFRRWQQPSPVLLLLKADAFPQRNFRQPTWPLQWKNCRPQRRFRKTDPLKSHFILS